MKISLIEPKTPFFNFYSPVIHVLPLMGPLYLGTILKNNGHDVIIYNENMTDIDLNRLKESDVLGLSMMTSTAPRGYEIARKYKELNPKGNGSDEKIIAGSPVENLDDLPYPDFSLMAGVKKRLKITPVSTSRGCPFDCTFCSVTAMFGRKYRFRSTESVMEEISRFKHRKMFFYDDNFDANKKRTRELLEKMIERKVTPGWIAQVRASVARDEDMVKLMATANCFMLCIGFESLNADVLEKYNKKQTPEDITNCIKVLHKHKINVHGMFISDGFCDAYHKLGVDSLQLCILVPILGSKLYTAMKSSGRIMADKFPSDWRLFDGGHVVHWPDNLSPVEMQRQTVESLRKYYSRANIVKLFLQGKFVNSFVRRQGHDVVKKWEAQNASYYTRLKKRAHIDKSLGFQQGNT